MVYLCLAILSSCAISVLMRIANQYLRNNMIMFAANYAVCGLLSFVFIYVDGSTVALSGTGASEEGMLFTILLGLLSGVLFLGSFMLLQFNIVKNGVVLAATFMKLGVVVPVTMSILLKWDKPTLIQIAGCLLAIFAIVIINGEGEIKRGSRYAGVWLVVLLLVGGFTDSLSNIYDKCGNPEFKNQYLLWIFLTAVMVSVIMAVIRKQRFTWMDAVWGMCIGIPNYFSTRFLLYALADVPAIIAYPVYNISAISIISLIGFWVFKESMTRRKLAGIVIIIAAILLLNG